MVLYRCQNCGKIYYSASLVVFACSNCGSEQFLTQSGGTQESDLRSRSRPIRLGEHGLLLFGDEQGFLSYALPLIQDGLRQAHQVIFVISPAQQSLLEDNLSSAERKAIAISSGREIYGDPFDPERSIDEYERRLSNSKRITRLLATADEAIAAGVNAETLQAYEAQAHRRLIDDKVSVICAYDTRSTPDSILKAARLTHPLRSSDHGAFEANPAYDPTAGLKTQSP